MFSHFAAFGVRHAIQPQAVLTRIYLGKQPAFELFKLHQVYLAFEHRFLNALPSAFADFGNSAQTSPPVSCFGVDVVAHNYQHVITLSNRKWDVEFSVATNGTRHQSRLYQRYQAEYHGLSK